MITSAFKFMLNKAGFMAGIRQYGSATNVAFTDLKIAPSNYFRVPEIDEQMVGRGRQYVIAADALSFTPKRGDTLKLTSTEFYSLSEVREMRAFGQIIGYRLFVD